MWYTGEPQGTAGKADEALLSVKEVTADWLSFMFGSVNLFLLSSIAVMCVGGRYLYVLTKKTHLEQQRLDTDLEKKKLEGHSDPVLPKENSLLSWVKKGVAGQD